MTLLCTSAHLLTRWQSRKVLAQQKSTNTLKVLCTLLRFRVDSSQLKSRLCATWFNPLTKCCERCYSSEVYMQSITADRNVRGVT